MLRFLAFVLLAGCLHRAPSPKLSALIVLHWTTTPGAVEYELFECAKQPCPAPSVVDAQWERVLVWEPKEVCDAQECSAPIVRDIPKQPILSYFFRSVDADGVGSALSEPVTIDVSKFTRVQQQ